jgi:putative phage-related membrane protein
MAISAYIGLPGHGKSYEVVKSVIIPSISSGRRVVSNIYGLNKKLIEEFCLSKNKKLSPENLGELVVVDNDACLSENFYPYKNAIDNNIETFCKPGDLIIIDEAWRFFPKKEKISDNHFSFLSEHRHFTDDKGISCDFVILNQDLTNLQKELVERIETTFKMTKLVAAGLKSRYRVDVFSGNKCWKTSKTASYQEKYDKDIFPLYKSYETENGRELVTDKRQNALNKSSIKYFAIFSVLIFGFSVYKLINFFHPSDSNTSQTEQTIQENSEVNSVSQPSNQLPIQIVPPLSTQWRITGELQKSGKNFVVLADNQGNLRLEPRSSFNFTGRMLEGIIDNQRVNYYSGVKQ